MKHVTIVGGGITGLSAALEITDLAGRYGLPVRCTLVEKESRLGGKILTLRRDGFLIEAGPDSFLGLKPWATALCRRLGLGDQLVGVQPGLPVYILHQGRLHPVPEGFLSGLSADFKSLAASALFSPVEKLRMLLEPFIPLERGQEDISVGDLIRRRLGQAALDRLAGPLLGGIYAGDPNELSVAATAPYLLDLLRSGPGLLMGALKMAARRKGANPSPAFLALASGVQDLVERLRAALLDVDIKTGVAVRTLERKSPASYHIGLSDGSALEADAVILAVPAFAAADLLAPLLPHAAEALRTIPYGSTATVALAYRREDVKHPLHGSGFLVSRGEDNLVTACTWVSSKWPWCAPSGHALLRAYVGAYGREEALALEDEQIVIAVEEVLAPVLHITGRPLFAIVSRWIRSMPQYTVGHLERVASIERSLDGLLGVYVAGAAYRGVGIPDCVRGGQEAARRALMELWPGALDRPNQNS